MTDKELRRLNKTELLWIIRDQEEEIAELKARLASAMSHDSPAVAPITAATVSHMAAREQEETEAFDLNARFAPSIDTERGDDRGD